MICDLTLLIIALFIIIIGDGDGLLIALIVVIVVALMVDTCSHPYHCPAGPTGPEDAEDYYKVCNSMTIVLSVY